MNLFLVADRDDECTRALSEIESRRLTEAVILPLRGLRLNIRLESSSPLIADWSDYGIKAIDVGFIGTSTFEFILNRLDDYLRSDVVEGHATLNDPAIRTAIVTAVGPQLLSPLIIFDRLLRDTTPRTLWLSGANNAADPLLRALARAHDIEVRCIR